MPLVQSDADVCTGEEVCIVCEWHPRLCHRHRVACQCHLVAWVRTETWKQSPPRRLAAYGYRNTLARLRVEVGIANQESVMMLNDHRTAPCLDAHVDAIDQAAASLLLGDASIVVRANPRSLATNWTRLA